jgi:iron complex transport system substrate-binding protein
MRWRAAAFATALLAAGLARAQISLRDDRDVTVTLAAAPQRIVSLLPSLTESVCALGGCGRLVGTDRFSNWPPEVNALPKLGGLDDAQIERIVALAPDLVLLSPSARLADRLEALGLKTLVLESRNHADVKRTLTLLAQALGRPAAAVQAWARIDTALRAAAARVPPRLRGKRVYFEVDTTPYAAGADSFIGQTLARIGLIDAISDALGPFPKLNPEYVLRLQPDIVMAAQPALADMRRRPGWQALQALGNGMTCGFTAARYELIVRPGPRLGEAADALADCLAGLPDLR